MTSSKTPWFFAGFLCWFFVLAVGYVHAEPPDLLDCGDGEDAAMVGKWGGYARQYREDAHSGLASFQLPRPASVNSPNFVEIDPSKTYELSGWFRSLKPEQPSRMLLDIRFYTEDKQPIKPRSVRPISSVSVLQDDAPERAKELKVVKSDWPKPAQLQVVVLNAKEDLSDLPNSEYVAFSGLEETDEGYVVTLATPLQKSYPAGTGVRLHRYLDHPRVWSNAVPSEWTRFSLQVAAKPVPGSRGRNYFWPGAKYMRVAILHQYTHYPKPLPEGEEPPVLLFDDIEIREVALQLAVDGKTTYAIVLPENANPVDAYAAETLAKYLKQITNAEFPVVAPGDVGATAHCIFVGMSDPALKRLGAGDPLAELGDEEHVCRSQGKDVFLYGEGIHGQLWAVVEFLEGSVGWRWYTPFEEAVMPSNPTLTLAPFNRKRGFSFKYRQTGSWFDPGFYYLKGKNMGWKNGNADRSPFVSAIPTTSFKHTMYSYIPPLPNAKYGNRFEWQDKKNYFETNPEFFTLNEQGKRVSEQLCFSNPRLRAEFTKNVLKDIDHARAKGWGKVYVTMHAADSGGRFCHCDGCVALEKKYHCNGGPMIDYAIELCETLQQQRPGVMVKLAAYRRSQTQHPPVLRDRKMLPENMIVAFAPIEDPYFSDWLHHADDPMVGETYRDLQGWSRIAHHMMGNLYPNPWGTGIDMPVGNVRRIVTMMRLMHENGVRGFFPDHPFILYRSGFSELQYYLMFKLLKDINCDADAVIEEFTDHHYGSAGPLLRKYLDELEQCRIDMELPPGADEGVRPVTFKSHNYDERTFPYLTAENIHRWQGYFDRMETLTADEPKALLHVQAERRELDLATVVRWKALKAMYPEHYKDYSVYAARVRTVNAKITKRQGVRPIGQATLQEFDFRLKIGEKDIALPDSLKGADPDRVRQYIPRQYARNTPNFIEAPDSPMGYATPVHLPDNPLLVRFSDVTNGRRGPTIHVGRKDITPGEYRLYELGDITVAPQCRIEFSGKSGMTHLRLGERLYEPGAGNKWKAYVELKFDGPTYGGKAEKDQVLVGRIILVSLGKDQFEK